MSARLVCLIHSRGRSEKKNTRTRRGGIIIRMMMDGLAHCVAAQAKIIPPRGEVRSGVRRSKCFVKKKLEPLNNISSKINKNMT
jgi:hypothetical protein